MGHQLQLQESGAGLCEPQLHPCTGLRVDNYSTLLTSRPEQFLSDRPIGGAAGADVTEWTDLTTAGGAFVSTNRAFFPTTLALRIVQSVSAAGTVRFRVYGRDQYGSRQIETTPVVAFNGGGLTNHEIYLAKVFSWVDRIQFQSTTLDVGPDRINAGQVIKWTHTDTGALEHLHSANLGVGLFRWMRHRESPVVVGGDSPRMVDPDPFVGFELPEIRAWNHSTSALATYTPIIGQQDGADWEGSTDKWAIPLPTAGWSDPTNIVRVMVFDRTAMHGFR